MPIKPDHIGGDEEDARRIIALGRFIAPCIDSFADDSEEQKTAIAILKGIASEVAAERRSRGSRRVRTQAVGTARVGYEVGSAFTDDDRDALRGLCAAGKSVPAGPVGSFPTGRLIERVWPEEY